MYTVLKRDGRIINFDIRKITNAIKLAFDAQERNYNDDVIDFLALKVTADFETHGATVGNEACLVNCDTAVCIRHNCDSVIFNFINILKCCCRICASKIKYGCVLLR